MRRHDSSEFDYRVLEQEFRRFLPTGQTALLELLENDDAHEDIAWLIAALGPLMPQQRQKIQTRWSVDRAQVYLPLLMDAHPMSRDLLLRSLEYPDADVREQTKRALLALPQAVIRMPLSESLTEPVLKSLQEDPIAAVAPYVSRMNVPGHEKGFAALLRSGEPSIVAAAYSALYRNNPSRAFNGLLAEMEQFETPEQSRAVGQMLAARNAKRSDGFYLKFSSDMSGDPKLSIPARASGLQALLLMKPDSFPELTLPRAEAFSYLIKGQPFSAKEAYLSYLKNVGSKPTMALMWDIAQSENWRNRAEIADIYADHSAYDEIVINLLKSNDIRSFEKGISLANSAHETSIRAQIDHPVIAIAKSARQKLGLPSTPKRLPSCQIKPFDLVDMRMQMPFFDDGWVIAQSKARVSLSRQFLTTAHPTQTGWLAGYDLENTGSRSIHRGGVVLHYDNSKGEYDKIGTFSGPLAILPNRSLRLGETTSRFWIVDSLGGDPLMTSAYILDLAGDVPRIRHIGELPYGAEDFAVMGDGALFVSFSNNDQPPIRLSQTGQMNLTCSQRSLSNVSGAPQ